MASQSSLFLLLLFFFSPTYLTFDLGVRKGEIARERHSYTCLAHKHHFVFPAMSESFPECSCSSEWHTRFRMCHWDLVVPSISSSSQHISKQWIYLGKSVDHWEWQTEEKGMLQLSHSAFKIKVWFRMLSLLDFSFQKCDSVRSDNLPDAELK